MFVDVGGRLVVVQYGSYAALYFLITKLFYFKIKSFSFHGGWRDCCSFCSAFRNYFIRCNQLLWPNSSLILVKSCVIIYFAMCHWATTYSVLTCWFSVSGPVRPAVTHGREDSARLVTITGPPPLPLTRFMQPPSLCPASYRQSVASQTSRDTVCDIDPPSWQHLVPQQWPQYKCCINWIIPGSDTTSVCRHIAFKCEWNKLEA